MSIASELTALAANKAAIKTAIEAKNPSTMPTDALSQWPTSIASIGGGGHGGWIYGYVIDESDSNPATRVVYIEDNVGFDPLYMDFANDALVWGDWRDFVEEYFRPAMLRSDGTIDYYLDPNDLTKKADGVTASDVADTSYDGNAMLIVKPIYYNIGRISPTKIRVRFSNVKQGDDWFNWTHLKSDGTYADFCGWPLFTGSVISSKLRSIATGNYPSYYGAFSTKYSAATANGSGWYTTTWADEMMIRLLFPLLCKSTDAQGSIGGGSSGRNSPYLKCGDLTDKGYFYGLPFSENSPSPSKFLGMESVWGDLWRTPCGIVALSNFFYVKLTPSTIDGSKTSTFLTSSGSDFAGKYICGMQRVGNSSVNGKIIEEISVDPNIATFPVGGRGTVGTSFYCDMYYPYGSNVNCVTFGGCGSSGNRSGIFAQDSSLDLNVDSYWAYSSSLSYHFY